MNKLTRIVCVAVAVGLVAVGCGDTEEPATNAGANNGGGKTDDANNASTNNGGRPVKEGPSICAGKIDNVSGNALGDGEELIKNLNDPIANLVLHAGDSCPGSFGDVMDKLRAADTDDRSCKVDNVRSGIGAMVVSETAQISGMPTNYRVVVTRTCNGRATHHIFFSLFGVSAGASSLPDAAEVMAFDPDAGMYNYYEVTGGRWEYFGSSKDLIDPGSPARCAQCHTGGGPVMKELDTPWLHWEGHEDTPGARELVDAHDDLGSKNSGSTMEGLVKAGNREWNATRIDHIKGSGSIKRLLAPLFCTVEVNLDNGNDFKSSSLSRIPNEFYLDPEWGIFGSVNMGSDIYQAAITEAGQTVTDGRNELGDDTIFDFVFPERAFADMDYVDKLQAMGILDEDLTRDVLAIDFTRPVFSARRCGLLEFAPDSLDELTPDKLKAGFIANLEGSEDPAAQQLLTNLQTADDAATHKAAVETFFNACKARPQDAHMADVMKMVTLTRNTARDLTVFEFPATMPFSELQVEEGTHFHPQTCELTND